MSPPYSRCAASRRRRSDAEHERSCGSGRGQRALVGCHWRASYRSMTSGPHAASALLAEINAVTGAAWTLQGPLAGGAQGGAWLVRDGSGAAVLKWHEADSEVPYNPDAADVSAYLTW